MRMHELTAISALLAVHAVRAEAGPWTEQISNSPQELFVVHAVSSDIVWAAGEGGQVVRTVNGGFDWEPRPVPANPSISAIFAIDDQLCVVGDRAGRLWRTTNGGFSWLQVAGAAGSFINCVHFFNAQHGWAVGDPVGESWIILQSTDGGASWAASPTPPPAGPGAGLTGSCDWIGDQTGVFGTNQWVIWRTTNGGAAWSPVTTHVQQVAGLVLSDEGIGLAAGDLDRLDRSTDAGQTWQLIQSPTPERLLTFDWIEGTQEVWGSTHQFGLFQSVNAGLNWVPFVFPPEYIAEDLDFADTQTGWSVGSLNGAGRIWRYSTAAGIDGTAPPAGLRVLTFPNPFTSEVTFNVTLPVGGPVEIGIYDLCGRWVTSIVNTLSSPDSNRFRWEAKNAAGRPVAMGSYCYQVTSRAGIVKGKVVKID